MTKNYPKPTNDRDKAKNDLKNWGYCLLLDAIPKEINENARIRIIEQAEAEKNLTQHLRMEVKLGNGENLKKII